MKFNLKGELVTDADGAPDITNLPESEGQHAQICPKCNAVLSVDDIVEVTDTEIKLQCQCGYAWSEPND